MLRLALDPEPMASLLGSGWPIFLLASKLAAPPLQAPHVARKERARQREDSGPDGRLHRALWGYMAVRTDSNVPEEAQNVKDEIARIAAELSPALRPVADLAVAAVGRVAFDHGASGGCPAEALLKEELTVASDVLAGALSSEEGSPLSLLFHPLPVLRLLDGLSLRGSAIIEHGVRLCLPTWRIPDMDTSKAAWVQAFGRSGCQEDFAELVASCNSTCVLDIGAQFGTCVAVLAKRFPRVQVRAMEWRSADMALLRRTAAVNSLGNLQALRKLVDIAKPKPKIWHARFVWPRTLCRSQRTARCASPEASRVVRRRGALAAPSPWSTHLAAKGLRRTGSCCG
mmetsp:Transcript_67522/g.181704  ORF Transcript_67522/g.181704 Transcript_67522/m.181704 type:complete len:342 (-) Transcript_67522:241-1266(-)